MGLRGVRRGGGAKKKVGLFNECPHGCDSDADLILVLKQRVSELELSFGRMYKDELFFKNQIKARET